MANIYVRSTDGSDANDGSGWSLAKATLAGAAAIDAPGDQIFVSQEHAHVIPGAANVSYALAGTPSDPVRILGVLDSAEPPTSMAPSYPYEQTTGTGNISISGSCYVSHMRFTAGDGTSGTPDISLNTTGGHVQIFDKCELRVNGIGVLTLGGQGVTGYLLTEIRESVLFFSSNQSSFVCHGDVTLRNVTLDPLSVPLAIFINQVGVSGRGGGSVLVEGCDLSALAVTSRLVPVSTTANAMRIIFRNCKLPPGWVGTLAGAGITTVGYRAEMWNCAPDGVDENFHLWIEDSAGTIRHETALVRDGGATDGDTPISWQMTASDVARFPSVVLRSPEIYVPNTDVGVSKTLTVEVLHDSATPLNDDEVWIEVQYLGVSGSPDSQFKDNAKANVLANASPQDSSSATWTTTGMSSPNTQKLSVDVTPEEKGVMIARVCFAKPGYTVYVDPKVEVS